MKVSKTEDAEKNFIANASHELRSPITIIRGFAETLQNHSKMSQEMIQEVSEKIYHTSLRLEKLVQSLLLLADVENLSNASFRRVELFPLVQACKNIALAAHPETHISLHSETPEIAINGEAGLLEIAVINLLENGIKYSARPAKIEVRIWQEEHEALISFQDSGVGIPTADLPHIFDRFYAVNKTHSRKLGGAGLGLSIVETIIEKHGGSIFATSELDKGSIFIIRIKKYEERAESSLL